MVGQYHIAWPHEEITELQEASFPASLRHYVRCASQLVWSVLEHRVLNSEFDIKMWISRWSIFQIPFVGPFSPVCSVFSCYHVTSTASRCRFLLKTVCAPRIFSFTLVSRLQRFRRVTSAVPIFFWLREQVLRDITVYLLKLKTNPFQVKMLPWKNSPGTALVDKR